MNSGLFKNTVGAKIASGEMTMDEYEKQCRADWENRIADTFYKRGREEALADVVKFCKSPEFIEAWTKAKGERFGEFLGKLLEERFHEK